MGLYKKLSNERTVSLFSILDIEMAFKKIVKRLSESPFCLNRTFTELSVTLFFLEHKLSVTHYIANGVILFARPCIDCTVYTLFGIETIIT